MNDEDQRKIAGPAINKLVADIHGVLQSANDSLSASINRCLVEMKKIWPDPEPKAPQGPVAVPNKEKKKEVKK